MNKRRQTRSPPLLYLALAVVRARPNRPPLPAQGTGKRVIELRGAATLGSGISPSKAATAKVGQDLLALHAEYQARLNQDEQARDGPPRPSNRATRSYQSPGGRHHRCRGVGQSRDRSAGAVPGPIPCAGVRVDRFRAPF